MSSRLSTVLTVSLAGLAMTTAGLAIAGGSGGGVGCIYGGHVAKVENLQPLVPADADNTSIDPKWLKLLERQEDTDAQSLALPIHN